MHSSPLLSPLKTICQQTEAARLARLARPRVRGWSGEIFRHHEERRGNFHVLKRKRAFKIFIKVKTSSEASVIIIHCFVRKVDQSPGIGNLSTGSLLHDVSKDCARN